MDDIDKLSMETAAYDGNLGAIKDAVEHLGLLSDSKTLEGIISIAVAEKQFGILDYLHMLGVSLNAPNHAGITPLIGAVFGANVHGVRYLLERGVPANQRDWEGNPILLCAIDAEVEDALCGMSPHDSSEPPAQANITELLLRYGADANSKNHHGETPLAFAISRRHRKAEELLKRHLNQITST